MIKKSSICLIVVYFGKLPNYFQLWLNSCRYNSTINFLLFIDDKTCYDVPQNVKIIYSNLISIKDMAKQKFDFDISLEYSYKLCDYKPVYGLIFEEYLKDYDYWGYCDIDTIFGNLRKFLDEDIIKQYDKIYSAGHFTIYKNDYKNKNAFKYVKDENGEFLYEKVFSTNSSFYFDEFYGIFKLYGVDENYSMYAKLDVIADISHRYVDLYPIDQLHHSNQVFEWSCKNEKCNLFGYYMFDGNIQKKEYMYIHLQKRNMKVSSVNSNKFYIVANEFKNLDGINKKLFKKMKMIRISYVKYKVKRFCQRKFGKGVKI